MNEQTLSAIEQNNLRHLGLISKEEIVLMIGDLYVVENVITKQRRQISLDNNVLIENKKRILRG